MAGRPKIFNEEEILDKAIEIFWAKGFEATSADELLKAMNIGKGSFYLAFKGGKKELFEKTLIHFSNKSSAAFQSKLDASKTPVEFLKAFFFALPDLSSDKKLRGCYLGNAVIEMAGNDIILKEKAGNLLSKLEVSFRKIVESAQGDGTLKTTVPARIIALHLINLWNGINITQRLLPSIEKLRDVIKLNLQVLE